MKKDYSNKTIITHPSVLTEELKHKKRKRILKRTITVAYVLLFIISNYVFWLTPMFKITTVAIEGEYEPQVKELLQPILEKHYLNRHILFAASKRSKQDVEHLVPHLVSMSSSRHFPSTIILRVQQRLPAFKITQPDGSKYVADRNTFVYMKGETDTTTPITIEIPTTTAVELNTQLYTNTHVSNIWANISQLYELFGLKTTKMSQIGSLTTQLSLYSQKRWFIMIDLNNDASNTIQTLKTFLSEKYKLEPSLSYIDLRIPNSVFYK